MKKYDHASDVRKIESELKAADLFNIRLSEDELATVLAALRNLEIDLDKETFDLPNAFPELFDDASPLTVDQIDGLCERINNERSS